MFFVFDVFDVIFFEEEFYVFCQFVDGFVFLGQYGWKVDFYVRGFDFYFGKFGIGCFIQFRCMQEGFGWDVVDIEVGVIQCVVYFNIGYFEVQLFSVNGVIIFVGVIIDDDDIKVI